MPKNVLKLEADRLIFQRLCTNVSFEFSDHGDYKDYCAGM